MTVFIHDSWMRLDFNHDGNVGVDDLTLTLSKFYEFLKNYDYIEATTRIKSEIYAQAQKLYREQPAEGQAIEDDIPLESVAQDEVKEGTPESQQTHFEAPQDNEPAEQSTTGSKKSKKNKK